MRILLLGGTAFTGPHIARELLAAGHAVTVFHRGVHPLEIEGVEEIRGDLRQIRLAAARLRSSAFDVVIHMLAMTREDAVAAVEVFRGYAGRVVVASSQDVFAAFGGLLGKEETAPTAGVTLTESSPLRKSRYIHGGDYEKLEVESAFQDAAEALPVTIMRMPAVYGPGDGQHRFFPWVTRMEARRPALVLEAGHANFRWSHAYVENVAHAFVLAATNDAAAGKTYNISEPHTPTHAERLHALAQAAGYRGRIVAAPRDRCPPHLILPVDFRFDLVAGDMPLRRELGYRELVSEEEGLRRTYEWQRGVCPLTAGIHLFDDEAEDAFLRLVGMLRKKKG
jgi:nucleoside-diphosphate-sugar epimerase